MPVVPAPAKVLVTGANGYIAMWLVRLLLEQGYSVRGTVRTADKGKHLTEYFGKLGFGGDKLEVVVVDDITRVSYLINILFIHFGSLHNRTEHSMKQSKGSTLLNTLRLPL